MATRVSTASTCVYQSLYRMSRYTLARAAGAHTTTFEGVTPFQGLSSGLGLNEGHVQEEEEDTRVTCLGLNEGHVQPPCRI